jgi:hypothetical protein
MKTTPWVVMMVLVTTSGWAARQPTPVSPGDGQTFAVVQTACPTFSWDPVAKADAHELVIYRVDAAGQAESEPTVLVRLPGAAGSWTPSLDQCLERDGQYAWSVRAVRRQEAWAWSPPNLFEVAPGPSEAEFQSALAMMRKYLLTGGGAQLEGVAETRAGPESKWGPETEASPTMPASVVGTTQLTVDGGVMATFFTGDGSSLTGIATDVEMTAHEGDPSAHHVKTVDTNTTYSEGFGLNLVETTFSVDPSEIATDAEMTAHAGDPSAHHVKTVDTNTTYSAGFGLNLVGTTFSVDPSDIHGGSPTAHSFTAGTLVKAEPGYVTLDSVTITTPVPGEVALIGSTSVSCNSGTCVCDGTINIDDNQTGSGLVQQVFFAFDAAFLQHPTVTATMQVLAGTRTFYLRGTGCSNGLVYSHRQLMAMFFPD